MSEGRGGLLSPFHRLTVMKPRQLTDQQSQFVLNYVRNGFNTYQAAIDAGYSEETAKAEAYRTLTKPHVREYIAKAQQITEKIHLNALVIAMDYKIKKLKRVVDQFIPDTGDINVNEASIGIKAIQELNKIAGDYAPEKRLSLTVDATKDKLKEINKQYEEY